MAGKSFVFKSSTKAKEIRGTKQGFPPIRFWKSLCIFWKGTNRPPSGWGERKGVRKGPKAFLKGRMLAGCGGGEARR